MDELRTRHGMRTQPLLAAQNRPRSPGVAYTVLTVTLAVLVGALALTSRQARPPTIAEFAPQAVEQITDSSGDAAGTHGGAYEQTSLVDERKDATRDGLKTIDVARVRRCVGDPPRQIEDPQSPPCVPYWSGDNGGATAKGVTRDEVRIADTGWSGPNAAMDRFFNARFEFYGRKLNFIDTTGDWSGGCSPEGQEAAAVAADEQRRVFASLAGVCGTVQYHVNLAKRRIISVAGEPPEYGESFMRARAPYMWSYQMAQDGMQALFGDWACARFAGRTARYAKGPEALQRRVFGIFSASFFTQDAPMDTTRLREGLAGCGERSAATFETSGNVFSDDAASSTQTYENAVLQMRQAGVTSIFCICQILPWRQLAAAATSNGYFPEWLIGSYAWNDVNWHISKLGPPEQRGQAMGLTFQPRQTRLAESPASWAEAEGDPAAAQRRTGSSEDALLNFAYRERLFLASGIQMAGPHLTPQTFEAGLHRTVFPNPPHDFLKPGKVGFAGGDHSMTDDAAEYWWSDTDKGPYNDDAGTICYVDHGERRTLGNFPSGDEPFFEALCDSGA